MQKTLRFLLVAVAIVVVAGGAWYLTRTSNQAAQVSNEPVDVVLPFVAFPTDELLNSGFVQGMEELGYQKDVDVVYHRPEESIPANPEGLEQVRSQMRSYIENGVDLIVVSANADAQIALEETAAAGVQVPIVGLDMIDPVEKGLVASYASSGNNLTGVAEERTDSVGKFLDLFTTIVPNIETMGVLTHGFMIPSEAAPAVDFYAALQQQTDEFGIELVEYALSETSSGAELTNELVGVLSEVEENEVDSWIHMPGHFIHDQQVYEHEMGIRTHIPVAMPATIEIDPETGEIAGLFAYGASFTEKAKQGAVMADKILNGAAPSELPVEHPVKYDLIINTGVAEEIGVEVPQEVLELADEIIE